MSTRETKANPVRRILMIGSIVLSFIAFLCFFWTLWYRNAFPTDDFHQVLLRLTGEMSMGSGWVGSFLLSALLPAVLCAAIAALALYFPRNPRWLPPRPVANLLSLVLSLVLLVQSAAGIGWIRHLNHTSRLNQLYETEYVTPTASAITFPETKRNLVYICVESLETVCLSRTHGGWMQEDLIPGLYALAQENVHFPVQTGMGGTALLPGQQTLAAAVIAQTAGIVPTDTAVDTLSETVSLNNLLFEAGYRQSAIVSQKQEALAQYFRQHDVENILSPAQESATAAQLCALAQQQLQQLSEGSRPFALMLAVDNPLADDWQKSLARTDDAICDLVNWIQDQDFYQNTTIIITGSHYAGTGAFLSDGIAQSPLRYGFCCVLGSGLTPGQISQRCFTALDLLPTTLAAMGCRIQKDRLGFGVDLFSETATLAESFGYSPFVQALEKNIP